MSRRGADEAVLDAVFASARRVPTRTALRRGPDALTYDGLRREVEGRAAALAAAGDDWTPLDAADPVAFTVDYLACRLAGRGSVAHGAQIPSLLRERRAALLRRWRGARNASDVVFFSSGSVGDGKPVPLHDAEILAAAHGYPEPAEIGAEDRVAVGSSIAHVFGFVRGTIHPLLLGAEIVYYQPRRDPLGEAEALGATLVLLPGPLVSLSARGSRRVSLKGVFSGGSTLSEESVAAVEERRGARVRLGYGLTEAAGLGSRQRLSLPRRKGTSGPPAPGLAISIVDRESGASVPAGATGEIRMSGAAVFEGYAGAAGGSPFDDAGRLKTGDLGYFDDAGDLVVRGRIDFSLVLHGRTVCAEEIESALTEHPAVSEAAIAPEGDSFSILYVARDADPADIRTFAQKRLPAFARPRRMIAVEELPRNPTGKLDRRAVASWLG